MFSARPNSTDFSAPDLGFRRVHAVRVWTGGGPTEFAIDGVVHRHPISRPVTAAIAARYVAAGVPLVIRTDDEESAC